MSILTFNQMGPQRKKQSKWPIGPSQISPIELPLECVIISCVLII